MCSLSEEEEDRGISSRSRQRTQPCLSLTLCVLVARPFSLPNLVKLFSSSQHAHLYTQPSTHMHSKHQIRTEYLWSVTCEERSRGSSSISVQMHPRERGRRKRGGGCGCSCGIVGSWGLGRVIKVRGSADALGMMEIMVGESRGSVGFGAYG